MKTVSVIIPVYNDEQYVGKAIASVCAQTYPHLEIIIVDDGATDSSPAIIDAAAEQDARIKVIRKKNGGLSSARNVGLAAATGDFICWLDSDDWMEPDMIRVLVETAEEEGADVALTNYYNVSVKNSKEIRYKLDGRRVYVGEEALHALVKKEITQAVWANIASRSLYEGIIYPEGKLFEDVRTMHMIYSRCKKLVLVEDILMNRLIRENSISNQRNVAKRIESSEAYLERQELINKLHPEWEKDFVANNFVTLKLLRSAVIHCPAKKCRENRDRIRPVVRYFRDRMDMYPGKDAKFGAKLEYHLLTTGTYVGMVLSFIVGRCSGKTTFLK